MGGVQRTVSKWIPNEIKKAIPNEVVKALPKEIAPYLPLGPVSAKAFDQQQAEAAAADAAAKAAADAQAKQLYDIQHPNIFGQTTLTATQNAPFTTTGQEVGPASTSDAAPSAFGAPTALTKAKPNAPNYVKPGGAGAALAQQAQDQNAFKLPSVSGLTFGGS
jgi:hypothetical protein